MNADVCVVGGGPAGLVAGLLFARAGLRTVVLEKHASFLRDFRGDTVHPSTLDFLDEIGLGERAERLPHRKVTDLAVTFPGRGTFPVADLARLKTRHPYIMFVPQWDFLDLIAEAASGYDGFTLLREHAASELVTENGTVTGVRTANGVEVRATLTIAADGRTSTIRDLAGVRPRTFGAPMDVLWFRVPRTATDRVGLDFRIGPGRIGIGIDRGSYWQVAFVIPKGGYEQVKAHGLAAFRTAVTDLVPEFAGRLDAVGSWDDISTLTVRIDRLDRWHSPGLLFIGDAAHAMSPIGGVGINLAIQDAVAAARLLIGPLTGGTLTTADLAKVRKRRLWPTAGTQFGQRMLQRAVIARVLGADKEITPPLPLKLLKRFPPARVVPARLVGIGLRPEPAPPAPTRKGTAQPR